MSEAMNVLELELERSLRAPRQRVWQALTQGEEIGRWYGPSDDFRVDVVEWDCRPGGSYRVAMHAPDGNTHTCFGTFREVEAPRRLSYTWSWEGQPPMDTLVTFELAEDGEMTKLRFSHTGFPSVESREHHKTGWTGNLDRLARLVTEGE
ncbi:MAG: SRPBCC domain-containing protein [Gemmatimonas sp.]|nr:SRPBCC domain-containing protein [Gemmatimonas sp.]